MTDRPTNRIASDPRTQRVYSQYPDESSAPTQASSLAWSVDDQAQPDPGAYYDPAGYAEPAGYAPYPGGYPADAPARSPLPRDLRLLDIAINLRAISLKGGPLSAEPQWLELVNRSELNEAAGLVNEISDSSMSLGVRVHR